LCPGLLKPVAAEVGFGRHASGPGLEEGIDIRVAEFTAQQLAAEERRVAHHKLGIGPRGGPRGGGVGALENGIAALEAAQLAQQGAVGDGEAVVAAPLEITDPHDHLRKIMGIGTEFETSELPRRHARDIADLQPCVGAVGDDLLLEDLELLQRDIKKIARTACRIEHRDVCQTIEEASLERVGFDDGFVALGRRKRAEVGSDRFFHAACATFGHGDQLSALGNELRARGALLLTLPEEEFAFADQRLALGQEPSGVDLGGLLPSGGEEVLDDRTHFGPFTAQRCQHDRLNEDFDILAAGVMSAKLGAFGGVEPAFEKGAEDGCVHGAPFELGGFVDGVDFVVREFERRRVGE